MVDLVPYFRKYRFEHGLRMLEKGYSAACDSLNEEIKRIDRDSAAYEEGLSNGASPKIEYDESGERLWDQSQLYEAESSDITSALFEVRKAFIIAFYHFWEDSVAQWMKLDGKQKAHKALVEYCVSQGYSPSPDLEAVRYLANYLKHGQNSKTDWLSQLRNTDPSFLPQSIFRGFWISEETFARVVAAILASGPSAWEFPTDTK